MAIISREPDGRWSATLAVDAEAPEPLPAAGRAVGVDLGDACGADVRHLETTPVQAAVK
jgi:hypothetical protein